MNKMALPEAKVGLRRQPKAETFYKVNCKQCTKPMTRSEAISGNILKMGTYMYHRKCFNCVTCKGSLSSKCSFVPHRGTGLQCTNCYLVNNAPKCHGCKKGTFDTCIKALDTFWHRDCFKCRGCNRPVKGNEFVCHEGFVYDEDCYYLVVKKIPTDKQDGK